MIQPGPPHGDSTRANDADRAVVCAILDDAYASGELDGGEHRQRCASAMSAKTRSQLSGLISDLQARAPVFGQQPAVANKGNPNLKWIVAATVGGVAIVGVIGCITFWLSVWNRSPTAPIATPSTPAAAQTETLSSAANGGFLALVDVVGEVSGDFQDSFGHPPQHVDCPGDLAGKMGAFERCSITDNGKHYTADVTVTGLTGTQISTHDSINEDAPPPSIRP